MAKCPKCGSTSLGGLLPTDFESRRCLDCGKVSDQWQEGIAYAGLSGQTDGGAGGPQGGSISSGEEEELPAGFVRGKNGGLVPDDKTRSVREADVVPFSGSGPLTFLEPSSSLPWQRSRNGTKRKEKLVRSAMPESYYQMLRLEAKLPESMLAEWMSDLVDDALDLGYRYASTASSGDKQVAHVLRHPETGHTLHINDGPHPTDKHWILRSKAGKTIGQGSADDPKDWFLDRFHPSGQIGDDRFSKSSKGPRTKSMIPATPRYAESAGYDDIRAGDRVTIHVHAGTGRNGPEYRPATGRAVMRGPAGWVLNMGGKHGTPGIAHAGNTLKVSKAKNPRNAYALMGGNRPATEATNWQAHSGREFHGEGQSPSHDSLTSSHGLRHDAYWDQSGTHVNSYRHPGNYYGHEIRTMHDDQGHFSWSRHAGAGLVKASGEGQKSLERHLQRNPLPGPVDRSGIRPNPGRMDTRDVPRDQWKESLESILEREPLIPMHLPPSVKEPMQKHGWKQTAGSSGDRWEPSMSQTWSHPKHGDIHVSLDFKRFSHPSKERGGEQGYVPKYMRGKDLSELPDYLKSLGESRGRPGLAEEEGFMTGYPTDATQIGKIMIRVIDDVNLRILAPSRILEQIEAYKFFEQFQMLLPKTPMLSIRVMERVASWWRNFAVPGDLLEIDCTSGFAKVTNARNRNVYALGTLGSIPDSASV